MPNLLDFSNLNALPKPWIPFNRTCSTSCPANYEDVCYNGTKTCKKCENGKYRKQLISDYLFHFKFLGALFPVCSHM